MDDTNNPKQALLKKLQDSTNILVTVSTNPSVDELAACLGLTLWLNKAGKHGTAVFSGDVPSTLEFLQPEATLEKNTDSLRDFIISLDKSKADKLRYKVEDKVVKIFITPYRTSLSADDLEYGQGDFNVDMVVALGVTSQQDLDMAITAHGRILHDATVATITTGEKSELGSINWSDEQASSLSELVVELGNGLNKDDLDGQIATALLTGIVAETDRFSNDKTSPQTMSLSAALMSAGANQQLVASKLEEEQVVTPVAEEQPADDNVPADNSSEDAPKKEDGTLEIAHNPDAAESADSDTPTDSETSDNTPEETTTEANNSFVSEPPARGGTLTANTVPEDVTQEASVDPLTSDLHQSTTPTTDNETPAELPAPTPPPPDWMPPQPWLDTPSETPAAESEAPVELPSDDSTLTEIEASVHSPHLEASDDLEAARQEVEQAINAAPVTNPEPVAALNAQPVDLQTPTPEQPTPAEQSTVFDPAAFGAISDPHPEPAADQPPVLEPLSVTPPPAEPTTITLPEPELTGPVDQPFTMPLPGALNPPVNPQPPTSVSNDPTAPPPVPPPMTNY